MPFTTPNSPQSTPEIALSMVALPTQFPNDVAALKALLVAQHQAYTVALEVAVATAVKNAVAATKLEAQAKMQHMIEQLVLARHKQFGVSSEQLSEQASLFDEAEVLAQSSTDAEDIAPLPSEEDAPPTDRTAKKPGRGKRSPLPSELERVEVLHEVPQAQRTCPCGTPMVVIGEDVSEQLDIVPMQIRVLRHIRKRYGCPGSVHVPVTAALPPQPLPKTNASAAFLAMLLTVKYVDGLPLTRFGKVLARSGVPVPDQTLARWVIGSSKMLQPLHNLMRDLQLESPYIHIDETVVQVLKEPNRKPTSQSYMWVQNGGPPGKSIVIYDYESSRSSEVPMRLLHDYRGYLMTDGYTGYNKIAKMEGITRMACWAHVRRKFMDAVKVQPKGKRGYANDAVGMIAQLYKVESDHKDASDEDRLQARQQISVPALASLRSWMDQTLLAVTPKSTLGKALSYMAKYWSMLTIYTQRGDLPIDNNKVENSIRPFVIGRRGWLFSDTPAGAQASALIYSLVETAKANDVEPYLWLLHVLTELPAATTVEDVDALLPWNFKTRQLSGTISD